MTRSWWPHLRTALILLHLFAITVLAFPAPGSGLNRSAWNDPTVQEELGAWQDRLEGVGLHFDSAEDFQDWLYGFARGYQDGLNAVMKPFRPYYRYAGTQQSWRMFVAPHRHPAILHVDLREGGEWRTVYLENSPTFTWHAAQLDHDRTRSALFRYAWSNYRRHYNAFTGWLAVELAREFPDAEQARFRYWKYRTLTPEQARAGEELSGRFQQVRRVDLVRLRREQADADAP